MDHSYWVRNYEQRVEEWREQRVQKMAARLQLHSNRQRTVSSSVLGYGNYRQQAPVQLDQRQHNESPRFNHVDKRWNPNYNYTGYREHNSPQKQYHYTDHRSHRSFHQNAYKKELYSSQKSLYNKKSTNKPNRKYSSCSNINSSASKTENEIVLPSELTTETVNEKGIASKMHLNGESSPQINTGIGDSLIPIQSLGGVSSVIEQDVHINGNILDYEPNSEVGESYVSESCGQVDFSSAITADMNKVVENLDSISNPELCETHLPVPNTHTDADNCLVGEVDIIGEHLFTKPNIKIGENESSKPQVELEGLNSTTIPLEVETSSDNMLSEQQYKLHEDLSPKDQNVSEAIQLSPVTKCIENGDEISVTEPQMRTDAECPLTFEVAGDITNKPKVEEFFSESMTSEENGAIANGFSELDLNLSFEPEIELVVGDSTCEPTDEAAELEAEVAVGTQSIVTSTDEEEREEASSNIESTNVVPVALIVTGDSETEASILIGDENDIAKEIEKVENKLSNISIDNKNICNDAELITPKKRERRKVFLDATNILQSSAIKYSVQEVRKNDDSEIIVTPVRRSLRISSMTPISSKNMCVHNLKELTPEVIQKMKFVNNPAIKTPPDC